MRTVQVTDANGDEVVAVQVILEPDDPRQVEVMVQDSEGKVRFRGHVDLLDLTCSAHPDH